MTVDELREFFGVRYDNQLIPKLGVSASTICKWRKEGINFVRQQALQLETKNKLVARCEDANLQKIEINKELE